MFLFTFCWKTLQISIERNIFTSIDRKNRIYIHIERKTYFPRKCINKLQKYCIPNTNHWAKSNIIYYHYLNESFFKCKWLVKMSNKAIEYSQYKYLPCVWVSEQSNACKADHIKIQLIIKMPFKWNPRWNLYRKHLHYIIWIIYFFFHLSKTRISYSSPYILH